MSLFPVRCFECGKVIKWEPFRILVEDKGLSQDEALDKLRMRRSCCRKQFKSHVPQIEEDLMLYNRGK